MVINFEGRVTKIEENTVTLDDGKIIKIGEDTTIASPNDNSTNNRGRLYSGVFRE